MHNGLAIACALLFVATASAQNRAIETCANGEPTTDKGLPDEDADGIADAIDNCLEVPNTTQRDSNDDGVGNICDGDLNNDNIVNISDLSLLRAQFFTDEASPDADLDGDGAVALSDLAVMRGLFFKPPGPVGPCLRDPSLCSGPRHFEASDQITQGGANLFVIRTMDPASIYHARRLIEGASQCNPAVAGYTFLGTQPWNPDWGFHVSGEIYFHGDSVNAPVGCNRSASFVEANLGSWCNIDSRATACQFWCPWTSALTRDLPVTSNPP
ncbi:MAG: dockerin type I repeat-containing protein [Gammaproteobacteria bacterium]